MDYGAFFDELEHIKEAGLPSYLRGVMRSGGQASKKALDRIAKFKRGRSSAKEVATLRKHLPSAGPISVSPRGVLSWNM